MDDSYFSRDSWYEREMDPKDGRACPRCRRPYNDGLREHSPRYQTIQAPRMKSYQSEPIYFAKPKLIRTVVIEEEYSTRYETLESMIYRPKTPSPKNKMWTRSISPDREMKKGNYYHKHRPSPEYHNDGCPCLKNQSYHSNNNCDICRGNKYW